MRTSKISNASIRKYTWHVIDSNAYLIHLDNHGLLIDTVDSRELFEDILRLDDLTIIITHSHFDHIYGLNKIREIVPGAKVISTEKCSDNLADPFRNMSSVANAYLSFYKGGVKCSIDSFVCAQSDIVFKNELSFMWNDISIKMKACYGHSNDGLLLLIDDKWLFSGDTLLPIPTVTRFVGGSTKCFLDEDIPYLQSLVGTVKTVFPGHGNPGTLESMLKINLK